VAVAIPTAVSFTSFTLFQGRTARGCTEYYYKKDYCRDEGLFHSVGGDLYYGNLLTIE
jgi:hypothetical protein